MLDLAIIIILIFGFFVGIKRGLILQLIHLTGFIIAFLVAKAYYMELAPKLTLWIPYPNLNSNSTVKMFFDQANFEDAYYRAIAFVIIFLAVKVIIQIIGSMLDFIAQLPILKQFNALAGGIFGVIEVYLIMFILLYIAALLPNETIQAPLQNSFMANLMIDHTPYLSQKIRDLWISYAAS
ncbi:CvpA family protein [Bacillus sp. 03113]|uniref:CvpA family protein n=1 Tax=Bacillus sp. 03113 TaxID=2578211 RepID=UPI00114148F3|nr:CvpA family protein [Bacillus sp. 03113]